MNIEFYGAAHTVTGSLAKLNIGNCTFLIDAGMYQGEKIKTLRKINEISDVIHKVDALFLTHAHLDHSGFLPILTNLGFDAPIFCSHETKELVEVILFDALNIQNEKIKKKEINEVQFTEEDIVKVIDLIITKPKLKVASFKDINFKFYPAGHILGATSILFSSDNKNIYFSGDIGRVNDLIHLDPLFPDKVDYLVLESTYGNRIHPFADYEEILELNIKRIQKTNGVLLIPAFAIARTQILTKALYDLMDKKQNLNLPVFIDSPMAIKATDIYLKNIKSLRITKDEFEKISKKFTFIRFGNDKDKLIKAKPPYILLSSSGMLSGGKVMEHLERYIIKDFNTVLFTGYQAKGTTGERILSGEKEIILNNKKVEVRAKIDSINSLSAHSDSEELIKFLRNIDGIKKVFLNHGEEEALLDFKKKLEEHFSYDIVIADMNKEYSLN